METGHKIRICDYRDRLIEIMGRYWENLIKCNAAKEDEKDAVHDVFVKLFTEEDEKVMEIIMGDEKAAKTYIYKMVKSFMGKAKKERMKRSKYAEDIRKILNCDECFEEAKDDVVDTLDKMEDFVERYVPMSCRVNKLWNLLLDGESVEGIMNKMGYANRHVLQVHLCRLKKRIKFFLGVRRKT